MTSHLLTVHRCCGAGKAGLLPGAGQHRVPAGRIQVHLATGQCAVLHLWQQQRQQPCCRTQCRGMLAAFPTGPLLLVTGPFADAFALELRARWRPLLRGFMAVMRAYEGVSSGSRAWRCLVLAGSAKAAKIMLNASALQQPPMLRSRLFCLAG